MTPEQNDTNAEPSLETELLGMKMRTPLIMASGTFGYAFEIARVADLDFSHIGAVILKSVTLEPRQGNPPPRVAETPAGMLNSVGLQNPGVDYVIRHYLGMLENFDTNFIASVAGHTVHEYVECSVKMASHESIRAVELNMSCPNVRDGRRFASDPAGAAALIRAVKERCPKPIIAKLAPGTEDVGEIAGACIDAGADALSAGNTYVGMVIDTRRRRPLLGGNTGGLSGPAIRPLAVHNVCLVHQVASQKNIPVIGCGGVMTGNDAAEMMLAGACAVQVGTAVFTNVHIAADISAGLRKYLVAQKENEVSAIVGTLQQNETS